ACCCLLMLSALFFFVLIFFFFFFFFFFQAEDGIRDRTVTGVQTCALPILRGRDDVPAPIGRAPRRRSQRPAVGAHRRRHGDQLRSEERRVGKECRSRWSTEQ